MNFLYPDLSLDERKERLTTECKKKETRNYMRSLQQSEIDAERGKYATDASEKKKLKKELENLTKNYKEKISAIEDRMDERLEKIETGKFTVTGILYGLPDYPNGRMLWRDQHGELVDSRDLLPDEMTGNLFAQKSVNDALKDLPFQTQEVVKGITGDIPNPADARDKIDLDEWRANEEDYLARATDVELREVYGTVDITEINKMIWDEKAGKYIAPVVKEKSEKPKTEKPKGKK